MGWQKKWKGVSEIYNDLDGKLSNLFTVLQHEKLFARFVRRVQAIPFSRREWDDAKRNLEERPDASKVSRAVWFFVLNRQSLAGRMDAFAGITKD